MEEKNIRWGELVGDLLIIFCSIALVISFWSQIAQRPFVKFYISNGLSIILFAVGFYTERRWKLRTTSRGILIIAMLLVPLNVLAIAAFTESSPPTDAISIGGEVVSIAVFALLIHWAARIVTPMAAWWMPLGVIVPSIAQLLTCRFIGTDAATLMLNGITLLPIGCYGLVVIGHLSRLWTCETVDERRANLLFILLGITTYATLLPLGLLFYKTGDLHATLHRTCSTFVILGVPGLASGLLLWKRITDRNMSGVRTAGATVGLLGTAIMAGAFVLALPDPMYLVPVIALIAALFAAVSRWFGIPAAYYLSGTGATAIWVLLYHVARGNLAWDVDQGSELVHVLMSAVTGSILVPLVGLFGCTGLLCQRADRPREGNVWKVVAAIVAVVSLLLVTAYGFARPGDLQGVRWVFGIGCDLASPRKSGGFAV